MAPFPDEVDVFTAPHWRMKQLVGLYCDKLSKTNFSNNHDFRALLQSLYATFEEFKMHEQIENEYIIGLLQQRSRTVYNVHSDNKLSEMLSLFEKGLKNVKNEYEQLNYAKQLKERLEAFTRDFLPHMKEEEEVFQPMLMEYFTYEELKDIKKKVIDQHCSQKETEELVRGLSLWNQIKISVDEKTDQGCIFLFPDPAFTAWLKAWSGRFSVGICRRAKVTENKIMDQNAKYFLASDHSDIGDIYSLLELAPAVSN